jgi:hypothetical protein
VITATNPREAAGVGRAADGVSGGGGRGGFLHTYERIACGEIICKADEGVSMKGVPSTSSDEHAPPPTATSAKE